MRLRDWKTVQDRRRRLAEGLAAIRTAMRYNVVPCSKRATAVAMAGVQEFDLGITIILADRARAPDSHERRQLIFRTVRYLCRAMRRRDIWICSKSRPARVDIYQSPSRRAKSTLPDGEAAHCSEKNTRGVQLAPGNGRANIFVGCDERDAYAYHSSKDLAGRLQHRYRRRDAG